METQPLQSSTTAPRQNYTSAKRLWLLLIPMAFTIPIIALMGYVLANREPATCEAYVSLCKDNPGETGLMDDSLTFVLSSAGLSLVAVVVGLSLGSCCKCDGLRCCHCGNVYALGSVFAQVASWIVLLAALVWMGTLALFLTLCQCPPKIAQVIRVRCLGCSLSAFLVLFCLTAILWSGVAGPDNNPGGGEGGASGSRQPSRWGELEASVHPMGWQ